MWNVITRFIQSYTNAWYIPNIRLTDLVEILILFILIYRIMVWIKNTKTWMLLRGFIVVGIFILIATVFQMHTILYLVRASLSIIAIAAVVVFQPELRRALEKLGEKNLLHNLPIISRKQGDLRFSDTTLNSIVAACKEMAKVKTGALIVVERAIRLTEYESTGIVLDSRLSMQLLLNIFENNTPLHDGAVIVRGDRIVSATCYLPLTDNTLISKDLGTRHRAAIGMSEVSDALVIVVSEETGHISLAQQGILKRDINEEYLKHELRITQYIGPERNSGKGESHHPQLNRGKKFTRD